MNKKEKAEARTKRRRARLIKKIAIWIVVLAVAGVLIFFLARGGDDSVLGGSAIEPVTAADWVKWNPDAAVTLVEYSDFQCPACATLFPIINSLETEFGNDIRFVYRHFPLNQIHFHANAAARASEAAGNQGKFWEMHDRLFETQTFWSSQDNVEEIFAGYAADFGLDAEQFMNDFNAQETNDRVGADYRGGISAGVNSTPSFFLNGEQIQNPRSNHEFAEILREALQEGRG